MTSFEQVRSKIKRLYNANPYIHMNAEFAVPKLPFINATVKIVGVYPNIFQIEENTSGTVQRHTLQYTEVLIKHIVIKELETE